MQERSCIVYGVGAGISGLLQLDIHVHHGYFRLLSPLQAHLLLQASASLYLIEPRQP